MAELSELLAKLDADSQVRGRQFEHICKWYLENAPKYLLELKKVWLWNDWPGKWGPDAGIDLIAKTYDNKLWAIQAKAYDEKYSIKKADIDTFLSESSRQVFSYRLLIATTNFVGRTAERTLNDQEKPVGRVLLSDLEKSEIEWPESPQELVAKPHKRKKPLAHQQKTISDMCTGFSDNGRGQLIMACGTGKTLVALWVAEKLQSQRTLVLVPSLSLLAQTLREWTTNSSQHFRYLPVCSDDTVRGADRLISKTSDLGLPVTTDPDEVAAFLRRRGHIVVFATYQSSPAIADAFARDRVPAFDLAIADEAHRCAGPDSGPFATILDAAAIKAKRRLFMTATPRYFTDRIRKEAKIVDFEVASMDDKSKFGPVFHWLSFSEAIEQDLLSDYQVVIVGVDEPTYREYAEEGKLVTTDGEKIIDARTLGSHIALVKAVSKYNLKRVISFHSRIKRAKEFSQRLPNVIRWMPESSRPSGILWSKHVTGEMSSGRRDALLDRFRHLEDGERGLLANARCLAEGIDLPNLDGVAFIDPRSSQVDIVQAVGRAIRKARDKKIGTVVLPVFIDTEQDAETALDSSIFKPVWNVLKALRAHDEVLGEILDQLRRQLGRYGNKTVALPQKLFIDLPISVGKSFADSFAVKLVEQSTPSWEFWFGLLEDYVDHEGHAIVPSNYVTASRHKLGSWVGKQRHLYRNGRLSRERQKSLEQLTGWTWHTLNSAWTKGFEYLLSYGEREGDTVVPIWHVTEDGYKLGRWVSYQRKRYKEGGLSAERCRMLMQLPGWAWDADEDAWVKALEYLRLYSLHEGNTLVPEGYVTDDGYKLGRWVKAVRDRGRKGRLSEEQVKALEQFQSWTWNTLEAGWIRGLKVLQAYLEREGNTLVPQDYITEDKFELGQWVSRQRQAHRKGKLSKERQQLLERLPIWKWHKLDAEWEEGFKRLCEYTRRKNHTIIPIGYIGEDGFPLGKWVNVKRTCYRTGKLSVDHQRKLEQLPGWRWSQINAYWQKNFALLLKYVKKHGDSHVPATYVTKNGFKLESWVFSQRQAYRQGKLSMEKQKTLEQLPGWLWEPLESTWGEGIKLLRQYVKSEGSALVPSGYITKDGYGLGNWVSKQRRGYRRGKLSVDRQSALEQLPGWIWDPHEDKWQKGFKCLLEYVKRTGSTRVPFKHISEDGYGLGNWVSKQRKNYQRGKLNVDQQGSLEQLPGWTWDPNETAWQKGFKSLCEYVELNGDVILPRHYVTKDGLKLGQWVSSQRESYRKGKLSAERQQALEQLPSWTWSPRKTEADKKRARSTAAGQMPSRPDPQ